MAQPSSRAHRDPTPQERGWDSKAMHGGVRSGAHWGLHEPQSGASGAAGSAFVAASATPGSRRALCLWLPTFELRLELVRAPELDATSVALLSPGESTRRTVWQVSERAHDAGVREGQLLSQAVSLCPTLTLLEPDPAHYDASVDAMLDALAELTPVVEPAGRGRVFLGMDGLERLYGPPLHQAERALHALFRIFPPPLVASIRAGAAPGKFGAGGAAASGRPGVPAVVPDGELASFLAGCPV
ncbi:MAG: hypothetical protein FIA95_16055, partial [Gemmatimonadetes bacterium]|nr:hypothetical protein [Gemmatimonadota bacterium]